MLNKFNDLLEDNREAVCFSNYHGRILNANSRFCRIFGFDTEEVVWHFMMDLHRNTEDWYSLQDYVEKFGGVEHYYARLKNRSGRSFHCLVTRQKTEDENGKVVYASVIQKITSAKAKDAGILNFQKMVNDKAAGQKGGLVYLTSCSECAKVRDSRGRWIDPTEGRAASFPMRAQKNLCPDCAQATYPEFTSESVVSAAL